MSELSVALVGTPWSGETSGGATFEDDVLRAALAAPSPRRFVVYPDTEATRAAVRDAGATSRVTFVAALREPGLPDRMWRRAERTLRRRAAPPPFAALSVALRDAGAQCAWMLGGSLVPLDLPYVATVWDLQHRVQPWFPEVSSTGEWRERERLYEEFIRRASAVIVGTETGAREVRDAYGPPAGGTHVIPFPAPAFALAASSTPLPPRPNGVPPRYVVYPAQFWAHKNHITAVRAIAEWQSLADPPALVCIGADRGTREHALREAHALGVESRVHSMGFVDRETLVALYRHAEALLYPSLFGPDNLPPLEAMALGCPVIAARVSGADEQIGDAGLLVDGLDAKGFAAAVRSLRDDPAARDAMVERGRVRARRWTSAQYASAVLALIDSRIAPVRALWP